jgi:hypothetical protein
MLGRDAVSVPFVVGRQQWNAQPFRGQVQSLGRPSYVVIHHAAGYRAGSQSDAIKQVRAIQTDHQKKWSDIGYHFVIASEGSIFQGRPYYRGATLDDVPQFAAGAHVLNMNTGKVGICLLGCFHPAQSGCNDTPTAAALASLERLTRFVCDVYGVVAGNIKTHRDFLSTACPGDTLYEAVRRMRDRIAADDL